MELLKEKAETKSFSKSEIDYSILPGISKKLHKIHYTKTSLIVNNEPFIILKKLFVNIKHKSKHKCFSIKKASRLIYLVFKYIIAT